MSRNASHVTPAAVRWSSNGLPISEEFDDFYFSKKDGLTESRYIYLEHNHLPERWQALTQQDQFVIAETGFGTGLNFLVSWQLWREKACKGAKLHYISIEKHPLSREDLRRCLALWPELSDLSQQLLDQYPLYLSQGFHRLNFDLGQLQLTLIIDDVNAALEQLLSSTHPAHQQPQRAIDAWFLDGFAPAKNPQMWQPELFQILHKLSHGKTTFATFSAARIVRDGLINNGFSVSKHPGFGSKREMLNGTIKQPYQLPSTEKYPTSRFNSDHPLAWPLADSTQAKPSAKCGKARVVVIGGGLAGCHIANSLARRDYSVTLIERHSALAQEGSGNPQGVVYAKLSHKPETLGDFNLTALQYALRHYQFAWQQDNTLMGQQCGVLQVAQTIKEQQLQQQVHESMGSNQLLQSVDPKTASAIAGCHINNPALFFPQAGWLNPAMICAELTQHSNIDLMYNQQPLLLNRLENSWQLLDSESSVIIEADTVIVATANDLKNISQCQHIPCKPVRGQISQLRQDTHQIPDINTVLCAEGYISPSMDKQFCFGASFDIHNQTLDITAADHQQNLDRLRTQFPGLINDKINPSDCTGRTALRCTTPDYLPLLGPVPIYDEFLERFKLLRKNAKSNIAHTGSYYPNLYISAGYGSRGLAYTPLCAEILAAQINNEPIPVSRTMHTALNPARFIIRNLCRNKI